MTDYNLPASVTEENPLYIDNSLLGTVASCGTKALLQYHHHLNSPELSSALLAGTIAHESLATYFTTKSADLALEKFKAGYYEHGQTLDPSENLSWENTSVTMAQWFSTHALESLPFTVLPSSVERTVIVPLWEEAWGKRVLFVGLIDAVLQWRDTGVLSILDHKTTGLPLNHHWKNKFYVSSQLSGYLWAAGRSAIHTQIPELSPSPGLPITSAMINTIQFSKLPDSTRKCKLHGLSYLECRQFHANFQLDGPLARTPLALQLWRQDAIRLTQKWLDLTQAYPTLDASQASPREGFFQYNGCLYCPFVEYCRGMYTPLQLPQMFRYQKWQPWLQGAIGGA